jgi:uncharacterized membrane protein
MDMLDGETEVRDYALERLMMLSDGVFAIAMTLLALDLQPAAGWNHTIAGLADAMGDQFQAFFWSFFSVGIFWLNHRRQFGFYRRAGRITSIINLVMLGEIVLVPPATVIFSHATDHLNAIFFYLSFFAAIGVTSALAWTYAVCVGGVLKPPVPGRFLAASQIITQTTLPVVMPALGLFSVYPAGRFLIFLLPLPVLAATGLRMLGRAMDRRWPMARGRGFAGGRPLRAAAGSAEPLE